MDVDGDGCHEWDPHMCPIPYSCCQATGECEACSAAQYGEMACKDSSTIIACDQNQYGCYYLDEQQCPDYMHCSDGKCKCTECSLGDDDKCFEGNYLKVCVANGYGSNCGIWQASACPQGYDCLEGKCVPPCTDPYEANDNFATAHMLQGVHTTCDDDSPFPIGLSMDGTSDVDYFYAFVEDNWCDFDPAFALSLDSPSVLTVCATSVLPNGSQPEGVGCDWFRVWGNFECITLPMKTKQIEGRTWCCNESSSIANVVVMNPEPVRGLVCLDPGETDLTYVYVRVSVTEGYSTELD